MKIKLLVEGFGRPRDLGTKITDFQSAERYVKNIITGDIAFYKHIADSPEGNDHIKFAGGMFDEHKNDTEFLNAAKELKNKLYAYVLSKSDGGNGANIQLDNLKDKAKELTEMHTLLKNFVDKWSIKKEDSFKPIKPIKPNDTIAAFTDDDLKNLSDPDKDVRAQGLEKLCGAYDSVLTLNGFIGLSSLNVLNTDDKLARKFILSAGISEINNKKSYILKGLDAASYGKKYYRVEKDGTYEVNANPNSDGNSNIILNANDFISVYNFLLNNKHTFRSAEDFIPIANADFYKLTQADQDDFLRAYYKAGAEKNELLKSLADKTFKNFADESEDGVKAIKKAITDADKEDLAAAVEDEAVKDALDKAFKK